MGGDIMKWNEIPKFKEYELTNPINLGFVSYVEFIKEQIQKYNLQLTPEFQRGHVWTQEQQEEYIEFFLRGGKTGRDFYFNWNKKTKEYVCVDGLQRTTALIKFVNGEILAFGQNFADFEFTKNETGGNPLPEYRINIYMNYLENTKEILEWYIDMNFGGTVHTVEEIGKVRDMMKTLV